MNTIRIFNFTKTAVAAAVAVAFSGSVFADPTILTDKSGMTAGSELSAIGRDDGNSQAAYQGKPPVSVRR